MPARLRNDLTWNSPSSLVSYTELVACPKGTHTTECLPNWKRDYFNHCHKTSHVTSPIVKGQLHFKTSDFMMGFYCKIVRIFNNNNCIPILYYFYNIISFIKFQCLRYFFSLFLALRKVLNNFKIFIFESN